MRKLLLAAALAAFVTAPAVAGWNDPGPTLPKPHPPKPPKPPKPQPTHTPKPHI